MGQSGPYLDTVQVIGTLEFLDLEFRLFDFDRSRRARAGGEEAQLALGERPGLEQFDELITDGAGGANDCHAGLASYRHG